MYFRGLFSDAVALSHSHSVLFQEMCQSKDFDQRFLESLDENWATMRGAIFGGFQSNAGKMHWTQVKLSIGQAAPGSNYADFFSELVKVCFYAQYSFAIQGFKQGQRELTPRSRDLLQRMMKEVAEFEDEKERSELELAFAVAERHKKHKGTNALKAALKETVKTLRNNEFLLYNDVAHMLGRLMASFGCGHHVLTVLAFFQEWLLEAVTSAVRLLASSRNSRRLKDFK